MTSNSNDEHIRCLQQRIESPVNNKKNDSDDIINRRHRIAYINFRKAVYRSLSLAHSNDEYNNIISYIKYCMKIFLTCLFIILTGALIRFIWLLNRY